MFDVTDVGQRSPPWPCELGESRNKIPSRVQALFFLCTVFVAANALK